MADALSCHPQSVDERSSKTSCKKYETAFYATKCEDAMNITNGEKLPIDYKQEITNEKESKDCVQVTGKAIVFNSIISVFNKITLLNIIIAQQVDVEIGKSLDTWN